jgi:hypothetical protein
MVIIRATHDELEVSGNYNELENITKKIERFAEQQESMTLCIKANTESSPEPYDTLLSALVIEKDDGMILVKVDAMEVRVYASPQNIDVFASYFSFEENDAINTHHHLEGFDGDDYIHPDSRSMVITLKS